MEESNEMTFLKNETKDDTALALWVDEDSSFAIQGSSYNEEVVLESDIEDMEDSKSHAIEIGPVPIVPFLETYHSSGPKCFKLETFTPDEQVHCSKRLFEAIKSIDTVPMAKIKLAIVPDWSGCAITTVIFKTDNFNYYHCPFPDCKKKFRKKYDIRAHLVTFHHGPFYCHFSECSKTFNSKVSKLRHIRKTTHNGHCDSSTTDLYNSQQIRKFCFIMSQKIESDEGFWMI